MTRLLQLSLAVFALSFAGLIGCQDQNSTGGEKKQSGGLFSCG